ncbi:hypothetical protein [Photobacterium alginatilyticum]|uniref:Uncharacterized protein n=1 Tax=Photobacterium alginatilyticum TaxID=1775171 RepID=A0ABW9YR80_9GAMM|nr:hypothetical protein [Photobacterium alginatilyticum]NBI56371.1 hypothetical protein [Photobacterium alginatilyticum]
MEELHNVIDLFRSFFVEINEILENDGYDLDKFDMASQRLLNTLKLIDFDKFVLSTYVLKPIFDERLTDRKSVLYKAFTKSEYLKVVLDNYCKEFGCSLSDPNDEVRSDVSLQFIDCDFCEVISHYNL